MSDDAPLRGMLLVAAPELTDPNFDRSVILVAEHGADGSMGIVLNHALPLTVADALPALAPCVDDDVPLHQGGPVATETVIALGDFSDVDAAAQIIFATVGFLRGDLPPEDSAPSTRRVRVYCGYAGWGSGQLEAEIAHRAWYVVAPRPDDVFSDDRDLWRRVLHRMGGTYAAIAQLPDDPSLN
jgi:putative transcriptional regulator